MRHFQPHGPPISNRPARTSNIQANPGLPVTIDRAKWRSSMGAQNFSLPVRGRGSGCLQHQLRQRAKRNDRYRANGRCSSILGAHAHAGSLKMERESQAQWRPKRIYRQN
ncbi:hypothetical protein FHS69_000848 [Erythrobacter flavus]|nr:hypothetical protein [Qipengyuania flava]